MGQLSWLNPYTNTVQNNIMVALADKTEMKTLHMVTSDPFRTPTFTPFADPDWFFFATGGANCATPAECAFIPPRSSQSFAWNHGDIQDEIASTWVGMVGPGVKTDPNYTGWTDHTDVRPTMLTPPRSQGRLPTTTAGPWSSRSTTGPCRRRCGLIARRCCRLGEVYKQLTASFGSFAMYMLVASTKALESGSSTDDSTYTTHRREDRGSDHAARRVDGADSRRA